MTNVKELNGLVNSQQDEQLHAVYKFDNRFLNQMKPVNHIFMFRSNIDYRNMQQNEKNFASLKRAYLHD